MTSVVVTLMTFFVEVTVTFLSCVDLHNGAYVIIITILYNILLNICVYYIHTVYKLYNGKNVTWLTSYLVCWFVF